MVVTKLKSWSFRDERKHRSASSEGKESREETAPGEPASDKHTTGGRKKQKNAQGKHLINKWLRLS